MIFKVTTAAAALAGLSVALSLCHTQTAHAEDEVFEGVFALPQSTGAVVGEMTLQKLEPLSRDMTLVFKDKETGEQIANFDEELTQQLHILATDAQLSRLIHQHIKAAGQDGTFTTRLKFPEPGLYHVFTDAVPSGYGQQVFRFDVSIGEGVSKAGSDPQGRAPSETDNSVLVSSKGGYTVRLDVSDLQAQRQGIVGILIQKDGAPAADITPYLGVAAHAVFIRADNLDYVHAHASGKPEDQAGGGHGSHHAEKPNARAGHHNPKEPTDPAQQGGHSAHGAQDSHTTHGTSVRPDVVNHASQHGGHANATLGDQVSAEMDLYVTPPASGEYALWIEFMGGGDVHTIPFRLDIPASQ